MRLLESLDINNVSQPRRIELLVGDLARLPQQHSVDVLVVSAFQNDYAPTPKSLIGALHGAGLSVYALSRDKQIDLREQFSCWLSKPLVGFPFRQILCIESGWKGNPLQITDDIFRALAPYLLSDLPNSSVAMPILGAGDQGYDPGKMLDSILNTAIAWMRRGLPLRLLKIAAFSQTQSDSARAAFASVRRREEGHTSSVQDNTAAPMRHDIFVSYSRKDKKFADFVIKCLEDMGNLQVFFDRTDLREGSSWPWQLANALDASRKVLALYSQNYWQSKNCQAEFLAALSRQEDSEAAILFPVYISDANIPYMFRNIQHVDCRVNDLEKISHACRRLASFLR